MILWFNSFSQLDFEALMSVYKETNELMGGTLYSQESAMMQVQLAERDFADYLRHTFFQQDAAVYCILAENGSYISAARIEKFEDGYLLSALETRPDCRRKGYGKCFLNALVSRCVSDDKVPIYSHVGNRNRASMALHLQCGFRVLKESARYLDGSVRTDSKTLIYEK